MYRNTNPDDRSGMDTKWRFALLDLDMGLSFYPTTNESHDIFYVISRDSVVGNMMCDLLKNESFKKAFILRYVTLVEEHFTPEYLSEVFEALFEEREALMPLQTARWGRDGAHKNRFYRAANEIRIFIEERNRYALEALYRYFQIDENDIEEWRHPRVSLIFDPRTVMVTVNGEPFDRQGMITLSQNPETLQITITPREGYAVSYVTVPHEDFIKSIEDTAFTLTITRTSIITVHTVKR